MTDASGQDGDRAPSIVQFVDQLIGPDVDAPEIKATLTEIASPIFDVLSGQKSGIAHIVEKSGIDEGTVIDVLLALETMPMPDAVAVQLIEHGFRPRRHSENPHRHQTGRHGTRDAARQAPQAGRHTNEWLGVMAGKDQQPTGFSVIERMAAKHHKAGGTPIRWDQLSKEDRKRLMQRMEDAVRVIPDVLRLKTQMASATVRTGEARDGMLEDHNQAKSSVLYGR